MSTVRAMRAWVSGVALLASAPLLAAEFFVGHGAGTINDEIVIPVQLAGDGVTVDAVVSVLYNPMHLEVLSLAGQNGGECEHVAASAKVIVLPPFGLPGAQPTDRTTLCSIRFRFTPPVFGSAPLDGSFFSCVASDGRISKACFVTDGVVGLYNIESEPRAGGNVALTGPAGGIVNRPLYFTNLDPVANHTLSGCAISGTAAISVASGGSISAEGGTLEMTLSCQVPAAPATTLSGELNCNTTDPAQPTMSYYVTCGARPSLDQPAPEDPLVGTGSDAGDQFGTSVAVSDAQDVEVVVIGAPEAGDGGGLVYVFERQPGGRLEPKGGSLTSASRPAAVLRPLKKAIGDKWGEVVAISPDGSQIAVGAPLAGGGAGSVTVFRSPMTGWSNPMALPPVAITAPAPQGGVTSGGFGSALAWGNDGTLVIGANKGNVPAAAGAGSAYLFQPAGPNAFAQLGSPMTPTVPTPNGGFGSSVARGPAFIAVGAPDEGSGALYAFQTSGAGPGAGQRTQQASGGFGGDKWGFSVAVSGNTIAVGAPGASTTAGAGSGLGTVVNRGPGNALTEVTTLLPAPGTTQGAGTSIATNGDVIVLGAPLANVGPDVNRGRVYSYDLDASLTATTNPRNTLENAGGAAGDRYGTAVSVGRRRLLVGVPFDDNTQSPMGDQANAGRADPYVLDRVFRDGLE